VPFRGIRCSVFVVMYVIFRTDGLTVCGRVKVRFEKIGPSVGVMCYVT